MRRYVLFLSFLCPAACVAQSFIGIPSSYQGIQRITANPANVNSVTTGTEFHLLSIGVTAGSNVGSFGLNGDAAFKREPGKHDRHVWENADILGPAIAFQVAKRHQVGVYTRFREIVRAGGIPGGLTILGEENSRFTDSSVRVNQVGAAAQAFAEVGFTYGRVLRDDYVQRLTVGATVKYLIGFAAATAQVSNGAIRQDTGGHLDRVAADAAVAYTAQAGALFNGDNANFVTKTGRTAFGLDLGVTYEFHPNGNPNYTTPYLYRVSAALTDLGGITYAADTGSGLYRVTVNRSEVSADRKDDERLGPYLDRLIADTLLQRKKALKEFYVGLPTALRLNGDFNLGGPVWLEASVLLSLRKAAGELYNPSYVNHLYLTPRLAFGAVSVGLPFGFVGYQTATVGAVVQLGPLVVGSSSAVSALMGKRLRAADAYVGLAFKFKPKKTGW